MEAPRWFVLLQTMLLTGVGFLNPSFRRGLCRLRVEDGQGFCLLVLHCLLLAFCKAEMQRLSVCLSLGTSIEAVTGNAFNWGD